MFSYNLPNSLSKNILYNMINSNIEEISELIPEYMNLLIFGNINTSNNKNANNITILIDKYSSNGIKININFECCLKNKINKKSKIDDKIRNHEEFEYESTVYFKNKKNGIMIQIYTLYQYLFA